MPVFCNNCGSENRDSSKFCSNCSGPLQQTFSPTGPLPTGTILENRYKIITLLKAGGMGAVYKAVDTKFDTICAVKELLPPYGASPQDLAKSAEWFKREAKLLNTLHHTNLPKVSDYFLAFGRYYLVMTFIEGEDLETILQNNGKHGLSEDKVINWAKQILTVLEYLHGQNPPIIYRDIKPGNIMLTKDGRAMLIDFGIARAVNKASQTKKTAIGTQGYAPPEQCRGQAVPQSDIYALGATMHHLLTGIEPIGFLFDPPRKSKPSLSVEIEAIVMKALKDSLNERFTSAKEMGEALLSLSVPMAILSNPQPVLLTPQISKTIPVNKVMPPSVVKESSRQTQQNHVIPSNKAKIKGTPQVDKKLAKKLVCKKDNSEMVLIPEGEFWMGENTKKFKVYLDDYYIDKYNVTNAQYCIFLNATHKKIDINFFISIINIDGVYKPKVGTENYPVVNVNWTDANAYAKWVGKRLPTEAEWEKAARGTDERKYPWGNDFDRSKFITYTSKVGEYLNGVSPYGVMDMVGNVGEWCYDFYDPDWYDRLYHKPELRKNPTGPSIGLRMGKVVRGGYTSSPCY